jgi:hypothetical protein
MTTYALVVMWAVILLFRVFLGGEGSALDEATLWALRVLTLVIVVRVVVAAVRFAKDSAAAARRGDQIFTESRVKQVVISVLTLGIACRVITWGSGEQGVVGWTGAVLVCFSIAALGVLYVRRAHAVRTEGLSYWHPYWTALLLAAWIASLVALGATRPTGTIGGILVGLFWLSLVALVVQVLGRRVQRRQ